MDGARSGGRQQVVHACRELCDIRAEISSLQFLERVDEQLAKTYEGGHQRGTLTGGRTALLHGPSRNDRMCRVARSAKGDGRWRHPGLHGASRAANRQTGQPIQSWRQLPTGRDGYRPAGFLKPAQSVSVQTTG